jgi:hypothetical protein
MARPPLFGLMYHPRMMGDDECGEVGGASGRGAEVVGQSLRQCYFVHQKWRMTQPGLPPCFLNIILTFAVSPVHSNFAESYKTALCSAEENFTFYNNRAFHVGIMVRSQVRSCGICGG